MDCDSHQNHRGQAFEIAEGCAYVCRVANDQRRWSLTRDVSRSPLVEVGETMRVSSFWDGVSAATGVSCSVRQCALHDWTTLMCSAALSFLLSESTAPNDASSILRFRFCGLCARYVATHCLKNFRSVPLGVRVVFPTRSTFGGFACVRRQTRPGDKSDDVSIHCKQLDDTEVLQQGDIHVSTRHGKVSTPCKPRTATVTREPRI